MYNALFQPIFDVPLFILTWVAMVLHFRDWAKRNNELGEILVERLLKAQTKASLVIILFFAGCWYFNLSFWLLLGIFLGLGALAGMGGIDVAAAPVLVACFMLREWAFEFPSLILHTLPPPSPDESFDNKLIGAEAIAIGPLRPLGRIQLNDETMEAAAVTGQLIEAGARVQITGCKNGIVQVQLVSDNPVEP